MAINIMYELEERMKKIEYVSTDSNNIFEVLKDRDDSNASKVMEIPKINEMSNSINEILKRLEDNSNLIKGNKENNQNSDIVINLLITLYDAIEDLKINAESEVMTEALAKILEKFQRNSEEVGLEVDNPLNKKYNLRNHEISSVEKRKAKENQMIVKVLKKGFIFKGRVIRKAVVVIVQN